MGPSVTHRTAPAANVVVLASMHGVLEEPLTHPIVYPPVNSAHIVSAIPVPMWKRGVWSLLTKKLTALAVTAETTPVRTQLVSTPVARPAAIKYWAAAQKSALPKARIHGKSQAPGVDSVPHWPVAVPVPVGHGAASAAQLNETPPVVPGERVATQLVGLVPGKRLSVGQGLGPTSPSLGGTGLSMAIDFP